MGLSRCRLVISPKQTMTDEKHAGFIESSDDDHDDESCVKFR
jgi:hypothetical protein